MCCRTVSPPRWRNTDAQKRQNELYAAHRGALLGRVFYACTPVAVRAPFTGAGTTRSPSPQAVVCAY